MVAVAAAWVWLVVAGGHAGSGAATMVHTHDATSGSRTVMTPTAWAVMCVAMMLPLALPALRHVALNSLRGRRLIGMVPFACGYLLPWVLLGLLALPLGELLTVDGGALGPATALLALTAAWQLTPMKRWAVLSCSRTVPLAPYGPRAWATRFEFGVRQALRCAAACWPVMLLMAVLPHGPRGVGVMMVLTVVMLMEMQSRHRRLLLPWLGVPFGIAAAATGMMAL